MYAAGLLACVRSFFLQRRCGLRHGARPSGPGLQARFAADSASGIRDGEFEFVCETSLEFSVRASVCLTYRARMRSLRIDSRDFPHPAHVRVCAQAVVLTVFSDEATVNVAWDSAGIVSLL